MREKLKALEEHYRFLEEKLSDPEIIKDQQQWQKYTREHAELAEIVENFRELQKTENDIQEAKDMLKEKLEEDMLLFLKEEMGLLTSRKDELEEKLKILLLPKDPNDEKDVIIELRAGTGGEEAALFAADLLRMYLRYAEKKQWSTEILDSHPTDIGGFKEIVLSVKGRGAYSRLKFERGAPRPKDSYHRIKRADSYLGRYGGCFA